jgi:putative transposase
MSRKKQIISTEFPIHITARCINKEWFKIPLEDIWTIMENQLFLLHHGFEFRIHSFVLMSNHFHMIVSTPKGNLSKGMNYFMGQSSRQIAFEAKRINQIYGARFHSSVINNPRYYLHAYKYVYRNPVEAGIVKDVCAYPYSTLHGLIGLRKLFIPVCYDNTLFEDFAGTLAWLNTKPLKTSYDQVRKALRKSNFSLARQRSNGKPSLLEYCKY